MTAIDLLPHLDALTPAAAERWVAAALAEAAALREHDSRLFPKTDDPAEMDRARRVRAAWQRWIGQAGELIARLGTDDPSGRRHVAGLYDLRVAHTTARGLVAFTPEELLRQSRQYEAGDMIPIEEVRRELRARRLARHAG